jgi:hypothetical protein
MEHVRKIKKGIIKMRYLIFSILITIMACCPSLDPSIKHIYVDRVFMNENTRYTFITIENGEAIVMEKSTHCPSKIHLYTDVPKGERMYIEYCNKCSGGSEILKQLDIHIHNLDEIQGGEWNHGKFGRGKTQVIE